MTTTVDISPQSFINALIVILGAWLLWVVKDVLVLLLLAVVLSAALHPAITWLERRGIPRPAGVISLYVLILGVMTIIVVTFAPLVVTQFQQVAVAIAHLLIRITGGGSSAITNAIASSMTSVVNFVSSNVVGAITSVSTVGLFILVAGLLIYYLTVDHGSFRRFLASIVPMQYRQPLIEQGNTIERRLSLWLRGQLTLGLVIAVFSGIGLFILQVPYAFVLALIAGLCELIPMIGPYIGMLPAAAIGFSVSPLIGVLVIALYYLIQQVENNFLAPKIVSRAVGLKPVVVFLALLMGARVLGVLGIILAVPIVILVEACYAMWRQVRQTQSSAKSHA